MSHKQFSSCACTACGERGHVASKCKAIALPPDGFFTGGGGGGGGHSHDDDDEKANRIVFDLLLEDIDCALDSLINHTNTTNHYTRSRIR